MISKIRTISNIGYRCIASPYIKLFFTKEKKTPFDTIMQSPYYRPRISVEDFLNQNGIQFKSNSNVHRARQCPFCEKPHYNDLTNLFTLNIQKDTGIYFCHRCSSKGSWMDLRAKFLGIDKTKLGSVMSNELTEPSSNQSPSTNQPLSDVQYSFYLYNTEKEQYKGSMNYLKERGFTEETIKKFNIGLGTQAFFSEQGHPIDVQVIYFPMYKPKHVKNIKKLSQQQKNERQIVKAKIRGVGSQNKKFMRQFPIGGNSGFFGFNLINSSEKFVVITQGQFDAMAVNQQTGYSAISLPQGANHLPDSIIPYLNQFQKIVLWMDNDEAGKVGQEKISYKLGINRTHIVKNQNPQLKDANDFLKNEPQKIKQLIDKAKNIPGQNILTFLDIKDLVKNRILNHESFCGVQLDWLKYFNKKVKGIRMQELSVVSGPTGCGKTTLLSQMSLDLLKKDIPVLWGSFEVRNQVLITNMLTQFCGVNLQKNKNMFDYYAEQFKNLPVYCLSFYGSSQVEKVLGTIQYAIEKYNISFVVLDTLQFFLSEQAEGIKKFDLQDKVMSRLRKIATDYKIHLVVVIHPRKTQESEDINIHSIYGTSKATQEADNIWIVQNRQNFRIFDIKKNRYDGEVGKVALGFDRSTKNFIELKKTQLSQLFNREASIEEIIENREVTKNLEDEKFELEDRIQQNKISEDEILNSKRRKR